MVLRVQFTVSNTWNFATLSFILFDTATFHEHTIITEYFSLPFPLEPRQAGFASEELLHGGLFEVALLGDELFDSIKQGIYIAQRRADSFHLAVSGRDRNFK